MSEVMDIIKRASNETGSDVPFYVADFSDVIYKLRYWKSKLPRVEPFYAVKCNSDPILLQLMVAIGMHFDCASKGEIEKVLYAGAKCSDIIYAHPFKSNSFLRYAESVHVDLMTFDCEEELLKIKQVYPDARLVLRIRIPNVRAGFPLSNKFGCDMNEYHHILDMARKLDMNVVGTSFHVGSLCEQPEAFGRAISMCKEIFDTAHEMGFHFDLLDIGGGFPGATGTFDLFDEMCYYINRGLKEHFPENSGIRIIAEPGCYMVCSAFTLCTKVLGKKYLERADSDDEELNKPQPKWYYYLNDGVYGSFAYGFEKYGFRILPLVNKSQLRQRAVCHSKLWGVSCCSSDCIIEDCLLPEMEVGECIAFDNMGAYTQCLTTNFNGFPTPKTKYIFSSQILNKNSKMPSFEDFCKDLSSSQLKAFITIQDFICQDDSNVDLFRKG